MDVVELRRRQAEIESRIYRTQDRLRTELLRLRGKVDVQRQTVADARKTGTQVLVGAGVGIVLALVTGLVRQLTKGRRQRNKDRKFAETLHHELEDHEAHGGFLHREGYLDDHRGHDLRYGRDLRDHHDMSAMRHDVRRDYDARLDRDMRDAREARSVRHDRDRYDRNEQHYLGSGRRAEASSGGYARRSQADEDHDHDWAKLPLRGRRGPQ